MDNEYNEMFGYHEDDDSCHCPDCRKENESRCSRCGGSGKVPTDDHESYLGAMYKPCPLCNYGSNWVIGEPPLS